MYTTMHCGVCAFMYLFTSLSPDSLHVLVYIRTHYMYFSAGDQDGVDNSSLVREQSFNFRKLLVFV